MSQAFRLAAAPPHGKAGETYDKLTAPDVQVFGLAIMAKVPYDLHAAVIRSFQHGQKTRPVVTACVLFDQMPANAIAYRANSMLPQLSVVFGHIAGVTCGLKKIKPATIRTAVGRAFESSPKKTGKHIAGTQPGDADDMAAYTCAEADRLSFSPIEEFS